MRGRSPTSNLDPAWGTPTGVPPVRLPPAARACVQTKHFEQVLSRSTRKERPTKGKPREGRQGEVWWGAPVSSGRSTFSICYGCSEGQKSLSELLRENLSVTRIKGCPLHHCGNPPEATGHPGWASNAHPALGTSQLANHRRHQRAARCHHSHTKPASHRNPKG